MASRRRKNPSLSSELEETALTEEEETSENMEQHEPEVTEQIAEQPEETESVQAIELPAVFEEPVEAPSEPVKVRASSYSNLRRVAHQKPAVDVQRRRNVPKFS